MPEVMERRRRQLCVRAVPTRGGAGGAASVGSELSGNVLFFAGTGLFCCWNLLFFLLQSIFVGSDVCGIYAGTRLNCCWNRLFLLLQSNLLDFDVCGFFCWKQSNLLLEPGVSFATIKFVRVYDLWEFCWNQSNLLLEPAVSFATIKFVGV